MTKIHLLAAEEHRYLQWGCLCVDSLIRNGGVKPQDIIFTIHDVLMGEGGRDVDVIKALGVTIRSINKEKCTWAKLVHVDAIFRSDPTITRIIQVDTDMVLTETLDFMARMDSMSGGCDVACYMSNEDALQVFRRRGCLIMEGFKNDASEQQKRRLNAFVKGTYGFTHYGFETYLKGRKWEHGGLIVINRSAMGEASHLALNKRVWSAIQTFSWISVDDEMAVAMARCSSLVFGGGFRFKQLDTNKFGFRIGPDEFSLSEGPGFIHFSGDWYRLQIAANKLALDTAFDELVARFLV